MEGQQQDRLARNGEPERPKKKPYATPRLVVYGNVEQLTSAGQVPKPQGPGDAEEFSAAIVSVVG